MKPSVLLRLALVGSRTDTARVILTGVSAALGVLALLAAATVAAIPELGPTGDGSESWNDRYTNGLLREPGLRPGVVVALLLLAIPVLALAGQCIRFGSPARDRRLARLRLAGATPGQAVLAAAAETLVAAGAGALLGVVVHLVGRTLLNRPDASGRLPLPTDVLPPIPVIIGVVLAVPVLAALVGAFLLRRVIITPLGVVRSTREHKPSIWPGVLILGGIFVPLIVQPVSSRLMRLGDGLGWSADLLVPLMFAVVALAVVGVIVGTGWITRTTGRLLHRFGRRPAMVVAGRQLLADPWSGSRTFAALLAGVIVGAGVLAFRSFMATEFAADDAYNALSEPVSSAGGNEFYFRSFELINIAVTVSVVLAAAGVMVALAEGIVSRRRGYAVLVATGVPRRTLGEAVAWQTLAPLVPAVAIAVTVGLGLVRSFGTTVSSGYSSRSICTGTPTQCADPAWTGYVEVPGAPPVTLSVPVPVGDLLLLFGGTLAAMLAVVGVGLLFLKMSTDLEELRVA